MLRLLLEEGQQHLAGFLRLFLQCVEAGQIKIGLVKVRGDANAGLELLFCVGISPLADKEHAEIVEGVGIIRAPIQRGLQILLGLIKLFLAGKQHSEAVVDLGIVGRDFQSAAEKLFGFVKGSLVAIEVSEVHKSDRISGP